MSSYQYRKSHCGDKMVVRSSYLHNGISYTGKMSSLYWIRAQRVFAICVVACDLSCIKMLHSAMGWSSSCCGEMVPVACISITHITFLILDSHWQVNQRNCNLWETSYLTHLPWYKTYASVNQVNIGSDDGLVRNKPMLGYCQLDP